MSSETLAITTTKTIELEQRIQKMEEFCKAMAQNNDSLTEIVRRLQRLEGKAK